MSSQRRKGPLNRQAVKSFHFRKKEYCPMWLDDADVRKTTQRRHARDPVQRMSSPPRPRPPSHRMLSWHSPAGLTSSEALKIQDCNRRAVRSTTSDTLCPSPVVRPRDHSGPCLRASPGVSGLRHFSSRIRRLEWVPAKAADRAVREVRTAVHAQLV